MDESGRLPEVDMEAVERLAGQVTGEWFQREPYTRRLRREEGSLACYHPANRPLVREQLNTSRRQHPEWPAEWYVRVPGSRVTWNPRDLAVWGLEGRTIVAAFPDAEQAEAFALKTWRDVWSRRDTAVVQVERQRVFVFDRERPGDADALREWAPVNREGLLNNAVFVMRHVDVSPGTGRFDLDVEAEARRSDWFEALGGPPTRRNRLDAVYFNAEAFERSGYRGFVEGARRVWTQAGEVAAADPSMRQKCKELRTALVSTVQVLNGDVEAAMGHEAPRVSRGGTTAPVLSEYAEFETWLAHRPQHGSAVVSASPVERSPIDFQRALDKAREVALALRPGPSTASDVNSIRLEMDRLSEQALAFRTREVGIYATGHVNEVVAQSITEGQAGLATDNRVAALDDNAIMAATKLPSGRFIVWRARTEGVDDELHPVTVGRRLFASLDEAKASVDGLAVTVVSSSEAVGEWRRAVRDPGVVREAMTSAPEAGAGRAPIGEREPAGGPANPVGPPRGAARSRSVDPLRRGHLGARGQGGPGEGGRGEPRAAARRRQGDARRGDRRDVCRSRDGGPGSLAGGGRPGGRPSGPGGEVAHDAVQREGGARRGAGRLVARLSGGHHDAGRGRRVDLPGDDERGRDQAQCGGARAAGQDAHPVHWG